MCWRFSFLLSLSRVVRRNDFIDLITIRMIENCSDDVFSTWRGISSRYFNDDYHVHRITDRRDTFYSSRERRRHRRSLNNNNISTCCFGFFFFFWKRWDDLFTTIFFVFVFSYCIILYLHTYTHTHTTQYPHNKTGCAVGHRCLGTERSITTEDRTI